MALSYFSDHVSMSTLFSSLLSFLPLPFPFLFGNGIWLKEYTEGAFMLSLGLQNLLLFDYFLRDHLCLGHFSL